MRTLFHDDEWDLIGEMEFYVFTWLHEHWFHEYIQMVWDEMF